jgi:hypothetical protein
MVENANQLSDFPPEQFTILVFCDACGRRAALDRMKVPAEATVQDLPGRLRCSSCGSRENSIRIIFTGAGGFHIGTSGTPPQP